MSAHGLGVGGGDSWRKRKESRRSKEGGGEEEQSRAKDKECGKCQSQAHRFVCQLLKRAKNSIMPSERSQVWKFHPASFLDLLEKADPFLRLHR